VSNEVLQMRKPTDDGARGSTRTGKVRRRLNKGAHNGSHRGRQEIDLGPLVGYLGYALRRAQLTAYADFIATLEEVALSPGEFGVLTIVNQNPGVRPVDVCNALGILKSNFVAVLATLERRGLVARRGSQNDRRTCALNLTATGTTLLQRGRTLQVEHEERMVEKLGTRGRTQLLQLLNKLADSF